MARIVSIIFSLLIFNAIAQEHSIKGIVDLRVHAVDSDAELDSYLSGSYGKFRFNQGTGVSLGQLGLQYHGSFEHNLSVKIVANAFADDFDTNAGITEAFIQYKGLPSKNGWRYKGKLGLFYPLISQENIANGWSTPYSITSSSLNNWIGEELRHTGVAFSLEKLGKFSRSPHNFTVDLSLFQNNDTAGAMLSWHGWTLGSRQSLLQDRLAVQPFPARDMKLSEQAAYSDPFLELDHRWGRHLVTEWRYKNKFKLNVGYYDNNAKRGLVEEGQYTWTTRFMHTGFKYKFSKQVELISQYMSGDTLMTSTTLEKVVYNDFENAFIMLRKQFNPHHIAVRLEAFSVGDLDDTIGDNNDEHGRAISLSYRYQLQRNQFVISEYNWLDSDRRSRGYIGQPQYLIERQFQLAYRYYF